MNLLISSRSISGQHRSLKGAAWVLLPLFGVFGIGCSNDDDEDEICEDVTVTSVDDDADFSSYETFAVFEIGDTIGDGGAGGGTGVEIPEEVETNLKVANDEAVAQLKKLGLDEVDPKDETPDLWIFSAAAQEGKDGTYWACVPGWSWWGWYYYWDPCAWLQPIDFEYTVGTLAVGVIDSSTEKPVFGGFVQGILECSEKHELNERIEAGVAEIFEDYPAD